MKPHKIHLIDPLNPNCTDCQELISRTQGVCYICGALVQPNLIEKHLNYHYKVESHLEYVAELIDKAKNSE